MMKIFICTYQTRMIILFFFSSHKVIFFIGDKKCFHHPKQTKRKVRQGFHLTSNGAVHPIHTHTDLRPFHRE